MKYLLSIPILLLALLSSSCDKEIISDQQADSFLKFYGSGMNDAGISVLTLEEGYLVMANIENPNSGLDICIIKTDKFGNSVQDPLIIGGDYEDIGNAIEPNDDGFVIVGSSRDRDFGFKDAYVVQINKSATALIWELDTGFAKDDEARDLIILENGNIAVCGYTDTETEGKNFLLLEIDYANDTNKLSQLTGTAEDEVANAIAKTPDQYMLVGWAGLPATSSTSASKRFWAARWGGGNEGAIPSDLRVLPYSENREIVDIVRTGDDTYLLACNIQQVESNATRIQLIEMDLAYHHNYEENIILGERTINLASTLKIRDNNIYISGTSSNAGLKGDMFVVRTHFSGSQPVYYYAGDGSSYLGNGFDLAADGGFILTGAAFINDQQSAVSLSKLAK